MFVELMPLLRRRRLLLTSALVESDTIRATVLPQKWSEIEDNSITTPLAITGTPEELDRELPGQLVDFVGAHLQLQTTLEAAKAEMDAAAKSAREEARKKAAKPATSTTAASAPKVTPEAPAPEPPPLFAPPAGAQPLPLEEGVERV